VEAIMLHGPTLIRERKGVLLCVSGFCHLPPEEPTSANKVLIKLRFTHLEPIRSRPND
jgi:hypothetical protein